MSTITSPGLFDERATDYALSRLFPQPNKYLNDPVSWCEDKLGDFLWSKQKEILDSVVRNRYTAVKSCHGPGKSYISSRAVGWWLDVHDLGSAFAITTAPTGPQVGAILWREMRRMHRQAKLPGRTTLDNKWYLSNENTRNKANPEDELIAYGRKPADYDEAAFQGIHAEFVLVVIDEACGVPKQLYDAIDSIVTNETSRVLAIGNPDDPSSYFKDICEDEDLWNLIHIPAHSTPAFTGEYVPDKVARVLTSKRWVEERKLKWGEESSLYSAKVMAEFPDISDETLFPPYVIRKSHECELAGMGTGRYGADIARMGEDKTVVYRNRDGNIRFEAEWAKTDTAKTTGKLKSILMAHTNLQVPMIIDIIGVGAGPFDTLRAEDYPVAPFQGSEKAMDERRFINRRAEVMWQFREAMEKGLIDLDPADEDLAAELGKPKWWVNPNGKIQVESKEEMKKRGVKSPNRADAAIMSWISARDSFDLINQRFKKSIAGDILTRPM